VSKNKKVAVITGAARGIGLATATRFLKEGYRTAVAVDQIVATFGRIDVLINNAGKAAFGKVMDTSFDVWREIMATNLDGPFICTQLCAPVMLESGGGAIVNIASISGLRASLLRVAYGTSKAAVVHLTKQQAAELGEGPHPGHS